VNQISLDWDTVKSAYPMRTPGVGLAGPLGAFMSALNRPYQTPEQQAAHSQAGPNTPCCVQMSHALSAAGVMIPPRSNRRATSAIRTSLGTRNYLLAVDEMKWFLEQNYGMGDEISRADDGSRRSLDDMKVVLDGRTGILVFSDLRYGTHTELWDENKMHQPDIGWGVFNAARVLFWDVMVTAVT